MNTHGVCVVSDHPGPAGGGRKPRHRAVQRGREGRPWPAPRPALVNLRHNSCVTQLYKKVLSDILTLLSGMSLTFLRK